MTTLELKAPDALGAGHQSRLYSLLAQAFRYPTDAFHERVASGELAGELAEAAGGLPFAVGVPGGLESSSPAALRQAHIELFELGGDAGTPAFVYEGEYGGGRLGVMEDVLRFYDHFGISPSVKEGTRERPDYIATELEFMHVLSFQEAAALQKGESAAAYRQAARDFLRFHLVDFTQAIAERTEPKGAAPYSGITALARDLCQQHLQHLRKEV